MINQYKNVRSPRVLGEIDIYEFLDNIKNPHPLILSNIIKARELYNNGNREEYNLIKTNELPCYTLNFTYNGYKKDTNIKEPSGLIYLDLDEDTNIDLSNEYIFASWTSLSNRGRGVAVRVLNLTLETFKRTYEDIASYLGISADMSAKKASQYTVQSFDPNIYFNEDASVWNISTTNSDITFDTKSSSNNNLIWNTPISDNDINKNNPITYTYIKEEKDVNELGLKLRYNNLDEIVFNNHPYLVYENEKYPYAEVVVPRKIGKGSRNNIISSICHQIYALNLSLNKEQLSMFIFSINSDRCSSPLPIREVAIIIEKTINNNDIQPILNKDRRIVFNPGANISKKIKDKIKARVVGKVRSKKTISNIQYVLDNWNVVVDGKITQKKLAEVSKKNIKTINKYYCLFWPQINSINKKLHSNK